MVADGGCIEQILSIIDETVVTSLDNTLETISLENKENAITIVTKNISDITIVINEGYELSNDNGIVYYTDTEGHRHIVGNVWYLNENSYQFLLENDEYTIVNFNCVNNSSTIRIDYCAHGLSEKHTEITQLGTCKQITIPKHNSNISTDSILITRGEVNYEQN